MIENLHTMALLAVLLSSIVPLSSAIKTFWDGNRHVGNRTLARVSYVTAITAYLILAVTSLTA